MPFCSFMMQSYCWSGWFYQPAHALSAAQSASKHQTTSLLSMCHVWAPADHRSIQIQKGLRGLLKRKSTQMTLDKPWVLFSKRIQSFRAQVITWKCVCHFCQGYIAGSTINPLVCRKFCNTFLLSRQSNAGASLGCSNPLPMHSQNWGEQPAQKGSFHTWEEEEEGRDDTKTSISHVHSTSPDLHPRKAACPWGMAHRVASLCGPSRTSISLKEISESV